jgi:hypothetical protein
MAGIDTEPTTGVRRIEVVVPSGDLHGWPVRTEDGELLGHVRDVHTNSDGQLAALDVRERWILGPVHTVSAGGMRIEHGEVVVPRSAARVMLERELEWQHAEELASEAEQRTQPLPIWIEGRERAARRFGGVDILAAVLGALAAFATIVLVGGVLRAWLELDAFVVDTSSASLDSVTGDAMLAIACSLLAGCLVGGWAAGRSCRFDGVANGLLAVTVLLGAGLVAAGLGADYGADWNVARMAGLPFVETPGFEAWGTIAFFVLVALMVGAGAVGGAIGEAWHRTADRVMLDVVQTPPGERHRPPRRRRPHDGMP